jgi:hypothetical protein
MTNLYAKERNNLLKLVILKSRKYRAILAKPGILSCPSVIFFVDL